MDWGSTSLAPISTSRSHSRCSSNCSTPPLCGGVDTGGPVERRRDRSARPVAIFLGVVAQNNWPIMRRHAPEPLGATGKSPIDLPCGKTSMTVDKGFRCENAPIALGLRETFNNSAHEILFIFSYYKKWGSSSANFGADPKSLVASIRSPGNVNIWRATLSQARQACLRGRHRDAFTTFRTCTPINTLFIGACEG